MKQRSQLATVVTASLRGFGKVCPAPDWPVWSHSNLMMVNRTGVTGTRVWSAVFLRVSVRDRDAIRRCLAYAVPAHRRAFASR